MKRILSISFLGLLIGLCSCKKNHDLPTVSPPHWTVDQTGQYPTSMTVVVQLPEDLRPYIQENDQIGAFVGEECRGIGTQVVSGSVSAFFILVHGTTSEQSMLSFQYYSSSKKHLYATPAFLKFTPDGSYGSADGPRTLDLDPAK
jgi:hypothetical protein